MRGTNILWGPIPQAKTSLIIFVSEEIVSKEKHVHRTAPKIVLLKGFLFYDSALVYWYMSKVFKNKLCN